MKNIAIYILSFLIFSANTSKAQCEYTITSQSGNTVNFQHIWAVVGINTIDSVFFDYGDATSQMFISGPPPGGIPGTSSHTYPGPGIYITCLTRYMSSLANPGVPIICTFCDTIVIPSSNCFVTSDFFVNNIVGNTVSFTNSSSCASCTSLLTSWDYGDGSPLSTIYQGSHTYALPGIYDVCLYMTGTNANNVTCTDTFCDFVFIPNISNPCIINPDFSISVSGSNVTYTNLTTCPSCATIDYFWDFGDGNTSNLTSPTHSYLIPSTYYPCLDITGTDSSGGFCFSTICDTVITTVAACPANASFPQPSGSGLNKSFFNGSSSCAGCSNSFVWDFGDGSPTSTAVNPVHSYATGGTYNVCLYMTTITLPPSITCTDTFCLNVIVNNPGCNVSANFNSSSTSLSVSFTDNSTYTNVNSSTYSWNFGDASPISTQQNPTHVYATAGTYNVCLTVNSISSTGLPCADTFCALVTALDPGVCIATANFTSTSNLLLATFNNTSVCTSCSSMTYSWNFGDGSPVNNSANPTHNYAISGTYNVCLTLTGTPLVGSNLCTHTICLPVTVQLPIGCTASPSFTSTSSGNLVSFVNSSSCNSCTSTTYLWTFGDGGTSTWNSPSHNYTTNGTFNVCLYVTGYASNQTICRDSLCKQIGLNALSINDIDKKVLSVYPNPTSNKVIVALPSNEMLHELQLMDVTGRTLKVISLKSVSGPEVELDLSTFSNGLYFVQITTAESKYKAQVIKQ